MEKIEVLRKIIENIEKVIVGKREPIELAVVALICEGHVLIEDVPGVGKTALVSSLAKSIDATFKRIQFTPDVLPSDITGFSIFNQKTNEFEFKPGAIMSQIILADEINRTSPKSQASLLEAMEEEQVTVDGVTYPLKKPFMVLATQNPIEYLGTFPLPEAQIDRFLMKIHIGYPSPDDENSILERYRTEDPLRGLSHVTDSDTILTIQREVREVHVDKSINDYIIQIVGKTRSNSDILLGASTRGALSLLRASQGWAYYSGRNYVIPDDVKKMAVPVLAHRLILKQEFKLKKRKASNVLNDILLDTDVPVQVRHADQ
jgi:MoxR-like ATPase